MDILELKQIIADAKSMYNAGNFTDSAKSFQAAAESYRLSGKELDAAEMANNCCVSLLQAGDSVGALNAVEGTAEIFEEADDLNRQAIALGNRAAALDACDQPEAAIADYQRASELFKQIENNDMYQYLRKKIFGYSRFLSRENLMNWSRDN